MVHGRDPLWESKRERQGGPMPELPRVSGQGIHLPNPSDRPLVAAIGVAGVMVVLSCCHHQALGPWGIIAGAAPILFIGVYNWVFEKGYSVLAPSTEATECPTKRTRWRTSTGLDNRKLAIWTFIGSECLFFATLISNYLVHQGRPGRPVPPRRMAVPPPASTSSRSSRSRS